MITTSNSSLQRSGTPNQSVDVLLHIRAVSGLSHVRTEFHNLLVVPSLAGPEPTLTAEQQTEKAMLITAYQVNIGDVDGAYSTVQQLVQAQPNDPAVMSAWARVIELQGAPELALVQANSALAAYYQSTTDFSEAPSSLLSMYQRLVGAVTTPNSTVSPTNTSASGAEVTFSPADQTVTLSAKVSSTAGRVDDGTVTFAITGAGNPVTSSPVTQGNASALFNIPGGTHAGGYPVLATYRCRASPQRSLHSFRCRRLQLRYGHCLPQRHSGALTVTAGNASQ